MKINKIIYSPIIPAALTVILLVIGFYYGDVVSQRHDNNVDSAVVPTSTATPIISFLNMVQPDKDRIDEIVTGVMEDSALATNEIEQELETLFAKYNMTDEDIEFFKLAGPGFIWANYDVLFFTDALESFKKGAPIKSEARANLEEVALMFETMTADVIKNSDQEMEKITKKEPALNPPSILTESDIEGLLNYSKTRLSKLDALMEGVLSPASVSEKDSWGITHALSDFNPPNPPVKIAWTGKVHGNLTYARLIFKNLTYGSRYKYFIAEPNDLIRNGGSMYSPTTRSIGDDDTVIVSGGVRDFCFWHDGVDDTKYRGCVPYIDIDEIETVK
ncbi:MAG: hypothetical protein UU13_C0020G0002 [Candidatus Nomurabacteria bacterium GW2011_GWB1_40_7]|uniref:Uncharacterized protein n=1 Tax=Candidatus Nomurabacteria bacterium GW2011_GWB1_40_7 TaxID=1618744 RepID=A0A0G0T564_9BACT|nr:MAG: hypothetical protein UU13_C0020G0002 [Candidatus Nomurabacteria bacterium GW2011_GWB1_40_7]